MDEEIKNQIFNPTDKIRMKIYFPLFDCISLTNPNSQDNKNKTIKWIVQIATNCYWEHKKSGKLHSKSPKGR